MKDMGFRRLICAGLMAAAFLFGGAERAHAACTSPAGNAADIIYDAEYRQLRYCNDAAWVLMRGLQSMTTIYMPHPIYLDGTDDYYTQAGIPANLADSRMVTGSVWVKRATTGTIDTIFAINDRFILRIASDGDIELSAENTADTDILNVSTTNTPTADTNWHHILFSIDMANSGNNRILVDGTSAPLSYTTNLNQNIDFTVTTHVVGASSTGTNLFGGLIMDLWIETGLYLDLDDNENYDKFSLTGTPILNFLGLRGERPMGTIPDFFISGPYETQSINKGTAGGYSVGPTTFLRVGTPYGEGIGPGICSNIGDVCADGTVYAGISVDGKLYMFADNADLPGTYTWNNGTTTGDSPLLATMGACNEDNDSGEGIACIKGQEMSALLGTTADGDAPYMAAQACEQSTAHGYTDWYLPSQAELIALQENEAAIGGFSNGDSYWSSSESHISGDAQNIVIPTGIWRSPMDTAMNVRCVRKGGCESPTGRAGEIVYNEDNRVLQFCDGFMWYAMGDVNPPGSPTGCTSPTGTGGHVVFNSASKVLQYCDGLNWQDLSGEVKGCGVNPAVGQLCPDGSIYAGLTTDGNVPMFATAIDSSVLRFSTQNNIDTASTNCTTGSSPGAQTTCRTGEANTTYFANLSNADAPYLQAQYCADLVVHGRDDWYMPSADELTLLYTARNTGAFAGTFNLTAYYNSSSEVSSSHVNMREFNTGTYSTGSKIATDRPTRCVRK